MPVPDRPPVFLERSGYRQRRLMDALRLLPILGCLLWLIPLFWQVAHPADASAAAPVRMSSAVLYVFSVWLGLILAAAVLARVLAPTLSRDTADDTSA